ncbi:two component transcriptional regulator, LuxR family [Sulfobacillus acidophilus DSM 10332]|uniref:Stage 0 sporulation protein A homolog n=1 Tax=Sulfobacillus acidophilus (strain ATCC 700253 / DSM 10332 / NAL) TaxID=679936 RepID=G8TVX9_SULAD|nr:two component transcriptional regulator, LuxR family [Sulfobacillus acidophilus DSM 10332]
MEKARIMLVDDHALFRSGLHSLLAGQPDLEVVGEADSGHQAVLMAEEVMPDLILMDINMPDGDGLEATRAIKERLPYVKICMLTASDDDDLLFEAIRAGAQGYLLKYLEPDQFLHEIRAQVRGEATISGDIAAKIIRSVAHRDEKEAQEPVQFTARELEVLRLVGQGLSNREIANTLFIAENTVKNHLRNILQKLHFENRVQAAAYAIRHGLVNDD